MLHEVSARVVIDMPREQAWQQLQDLSLPHNYVPGVLRCEITSDQPSGVGASRRVFQSLGRNMDETVIEWNEGHGLVLRLHQGDSDAPAPFERAVFRYRLDDAGHQQTALTATLAFDMRWGRFGQYLYSRVLRGVFRSVVRDVAISMKGFYESGEAVTPPVLKQLRSSAQANG
ncbi:MAG: SRPBCC family protein [Spongiibacteraceae bacterium]